jgi:hypothetical protein
VALKAGFWILEAATPKQAFTQQALFSQQLKATNILLSKRRQCLSAQPARNLKLCRSNCLWAGKFRKTSALVSNRNVADTLRAIYNPLEFAQTDPVDASID